MKHAYRTLTSAFVQGGGSVLVVLWRLSNQESVTGNLSVHLIEDDPVIRDGISNLMEDVGLSVEAYASALDFVPTI